MKERNWIRKQEKSYVAYCSNCKCPMLADGRSECEACSNPIFNIYKSPSTSIKLKMEYLGHVAKKNTPNP